MARAMHNHVPNLSVNRTTRKLRLRVPFGLRRPVTSNVRRQLLHSSTVRVGYMADVVPLTQLTKRGG